MNNTQSPKRVVVLVSGGGSNLQAILDASKRTATFDVVAVLSNRPGAGGLVRAQNASVATDTVDHTQYADRESFDRALMAAIDAHRPDVVVLAGFMRILTPVFTEHYLGRMLNIHPSLLPKYPGLHTHQRALDAGDEVHGVTVHFVTAELDGGPPVIQARVAIEEGDDASRLAARVLTQEHVIYPLAVQWFAEGRLTLHDNRAWLDEAPLPSHGVAFDSGCA